MEISECVIQINSETNLIILVASGQGMFMKNGIILSIADRIKDALPIPTDEFRKRLEEDCYVIWKLPQFYIRQITQSSIIPTCTEYIEAKNAEVHGAYGSARH